MPWCNFRYVALLQTTHIEHKNEGGYPQQPTDVSSNFQMGRKSKYYQYALFGQITATKRLKSRRRDGESLRQSMDHMEMPQPSAHGVQLQQDKERSGSSTQYTPHMLVEEQKKPPYICYSAPNLHIPALWMTSLRLMM